MLFFRARASGLIVNNPYMPAQETQLKFSCVLLPVRDLEMMTAFYRDVLDFSEAESADPTRSNFNLGTTTLCLYQANAPMRDDATIGAIMLFRVPDVAAMREQLTERGVHMGKLKTFGAHAECDGRDPEGNLFRLSNQA